MLAILASRAARASDGSQLAQVLRESNWLGGRVFGPAGLLLLASGIALVIDGDWGFDELWIQLGLAGYVASALIGALFYGRQSRRILDTADGAAAIRRYLLVSRIDLAILLVVVFLMVVKPD